MTNPVTLYCVDDDCVNLQLLEGILKDYNCVLFESGQACLDAAEKQAPDLILLDVMMPIMDGLETCLALREHPSLHHVPVIFISAKTALDARLDGYMAGGDDYVAKPFDASELIAKVRAALGRKESLDSTRKELEDISQTTMEMVTTLGETNAVVHFLQSTFRCKTYKALADEVINAHSSLGREVAVQFRVDDEKLYYATGGVENPLEESVFEFIREKGRLIDFGERTVVNFPKVSVLIRNMPLDDKDLHGRIRDHIAMIAQGAESKLTTLSAELLIKRQHDSLVQIVNDVETAVVEIDAEYKQQQKGSDEIMSTVAQSIEESFLTLGLTGEQEEHLSTIVDTAEEQTKSLYEAGLAMDEKFTGILAKIQSTLEDSVVEIVEEEEEEGVGDAAFFF